VPHEYKLRPVDGKLELSGGQLDETLKYPVDDLEGARRVVGFLSQRQGSVLQIYDVRGTLIETQQREPVMPMENAVGGLAGPS
jgi:hypothetical protein